MTQILLRKRKTNKKILSVCFVEVFFSGNYGAERKIFFLYINQINLTVHIIEKLLFGLNKGKL